MSQDPREWRRLLVRLPNWVGDVVMATPVLRALRRHLTETEIVVAMRSYVAPLMQGASFVDGVIALQKNEEHGIGGFRRHARRLRDGSFDAALLLTNSLTSAIPVAMARIPRRIGYRGDGRSLLLTDRVSPERVGSQRVAVPMPVYYQRLLDAVGIPAAGPEYDLVVTDDDREMGRASLLRLGWDGVEPLVAVNPGARFGSSKLWLPERYGDVVRRLEEELGVRTVVLCGPGEEELVKQICARAGPRVLDGSRDIIGLRALGGLLSHVRLLITNDTGPRHMAIALGLPVVVVFGSTDPAWTAWNLSLSTILRKDVPCGPCHLKTCPIDHRCMTSISVDEVFAASRHRIGL